jgi:hypothetical protein
VFEPRALTLELIEKFRLFLQLGQRSEVRVHVRPIRPA